MAPKKAAPPANAAAEPPAPFAGTSVVPYDASASADASVNPAKHPIGIILLSQPTVKEICFSIAKEYFKDTVANFNALPARLDAEILQWTNKEAMTLKILWRVDDKHTHSSLDGLLDPEYAMRLEKYVDGRSAPKAKGMTWRREYAIAVSSGPYAASEVTDDGEIHVDYKEGTRLLTQVWKKVTPQHVKDDWRGTDRFRLKCLIPEHKTNTF